MYRERCDSVVPYPKPRKALGSNGISMYADVKDLTPRDVKTAPLIRIDVTHGRPPRPGKEADFPISLPLPRKAVAAAPGG